MAIFECVHFERTLVLTFNNNPFPKRHAPRGCHSHTSSVAAEFGFGKSSTAVTQLKVYPWRFTVPDLTICNVYFMIQYGLKLNKECIVELYYR